MTPREELEQIADGEPILFISFGKWDDYNSEICKVHVPQEQLNKPMAWRDAIPYLEVEDWTFDGGFGAQECYSVYAWTPNFVIVVQEYDGATCLNKIPRHPFDYEVESL